MLNLTLRTTRIRLIPPHLRTLSTKPTLEFNTEMNFLNFPDQAIFAGTASLAPFLDRLAATKVKKTLIVTDAGVASLGILDEVKAAFEAEGLDYAVFAECTPDPGFADVRGIAEAYQTHGCDSCVGLGGTFAGDGCWFAQEASRGFHVG